MSIEIKEVIKRGFPVERVLMYRESYELSDWKPVKREYLTQKEFDEVKALREGVESE